jgi:hypothetical protein
MLDIAVPLTTVKPADDGLRQLKPTTSDEIVRRGQDALQRLRRSYDDWTDIAEALAVGRAEVMAATHTNQPTGKRYAKAMGEWLLARSFHLINEGTRNRLLECLQHRNEIEKWRARLTDTERFRFNHPDTVLRKWKAATVILDRNASPKPPSAFAKLKEVNVDLQERLHRAEREIAAGGGDLWTPKDAPDVIANVMLAHLLPSKAERVAREILKKVKERKASGA